MELNFVSVHKNGKGNLADLPTPDKGKSGDSWNKSRNSTKSSESLFFPDQD